MNETLIRTLSGAVYIAVLVGCSLFYPSFLAVFTLFLMICIYEFSRLVGLKPWIPLLLGTGFYALFAGFKLDQTTALLLAAGAIFVSARLIHFVLTQRFSYLTKTDKYVYLFGYLALPFVFLVQIPILNGSFEPQRLIGIFVLIWANDTFAFLCGKNFGKRKLLERVSPKKTVEGFVGGWLFALLFAWPVSNYIASEPFWQWLILASAVSVFGTIGDLVESKFKRLAGVKDSGKIMPGHGGLLDRLDSVIFVAPFVFAFYHLIN